MKFLIKKENQLLKRKKQRFDSKFYLVDEKKDFHTKEGMIKSDELQKKAGHCIKIKNSEFALLDPQFIDFYRNIKRHAQIITLKDLGTIIVETGMTKDSVIVESGCGSGGLSIYLSKIVKKIISYDNNDMSLEVTKKILKILK
jgi:tRNA (adenine57-N1/adenine58-N1)-methyltransferase